MELRKYIIPCAYFKSVQVRRQHPLRIMNIFVITEYSFNFLKEITKNLKMTVISKRAL